MVETLIWPGKTGVSTLSGTSRVCHKSILSSNLTEARHRQPQQPAQRPESTRSSTTDDEVRYYQLGPVLLSIESRILSLVGWFCPINWCFEFRDDRKSFLSSRNQFATIIGRVKKVHALATPLIFAKDVVDMNSFKVSFAP